VRAATAALCQKRMRQVQKWVGKRFNLFVRNTYPDTVPVRIKRNERLAKNSMFGLLFYLHTAL
jgi:hypothetical protein